MSRLSVAIHSLSYTRFNNGLSLPTMSNGRYLDGNTTTDAVGFGMKLGYDWKPNLSGYVTPYTRQSLACSDSGDDYQLSNDMRMDGQSSTVCVMNGRRCRLYLDYSGAGVNALLSNWLTCMTMPTTMLTSTMTALIHGVEGSAVRVGLGTQFSFTKASAYTDATYLGGGDVRPELGCKPGCEIQLVK
ncbi:autotransporter outer membrane beta-barrel domain-containing protein [Shigella flexneri]